MLGCTLAPPPFASPQAPPIFLHTRAEDPKRADAHDPCARTRIPQLATHDSTIDDSPPPFSFFLSFLAGLGPFSICGRYWSGIWVRLVHYVHYTTGCSHPERLSVRQVGARFPETTLTTHTHTHTQPTTLKPISSPTPPSFHTPSPLPLDLTPPDAQMPSTRHTHPNPAHHINQLADWAVTSTRLTLAYPRYPRTPVPSAAVVEGFRRGTSAQAPTLLFCLLPNCLSSPDSEDAASSSGGSLFIPDGTTCASLRHGRLPSFPAASHAAQAKPGYDFA